MEHIPAELLHETFIKLVLEDRLECMLVCRRWYDIVNKRSLLHSLVISDHVFPKLKEMIERKPYRAPQMEYLKLYTFSHRDCDKRIFCNMFPNLRKIYLQKGNDVYQKRNYLDTPFELTHPTSKLEKITDYGECELTCQLAMSNMCSNLKSLELSFTNLPDSMSSLVLSQLKNMPELKTLTLSECRVKLMDLEMMHDSLPSIKSLRLSSTEILSGENPRDVMPAGLITTLGIGLGSAEDINTHIQLYKYIAKKYPSVNNPIIGDYTIQDKNADYTRKLYNEGILPLYQHTGYQSDTFLFQSYCNGLDAFRKFDDYGMKLKYLIINSSADDKILSLDELVHSQQSNYIQKLTLNYIVPEHLEMMSNMEALRYLEINCQPSIVYPHRNRNIRAINFSQLIDACPPALTNLTIKGLELEFNESTSNLTYIQYMKLEGVVIKSATTITGTSFPKLSVLHFGAIIKSDVTISLLNQHLKEVAIGIRYPEYESCRLSVNTMYDGKPQCSVMWPANNSGIGGELYRDSMPISNSIGRTVHFTCDSVKKLTYYMGEQEREYDDSDSDDVDEDEYDGYGNGYNEYGYSENSVDDDDEYIVL